MVEHHLGIKPTTFELQAQVPNNYTTLLPCQTDYIFFQLLMTSHCGKTPNELCVLKSVFSINILSYVISHNF